MASLAVAQTLLPSQVTPQSFKPDAAPRLSVFEISSAAALTAPAGAERVMMTFGTVEIEGGLVELRASHDGVVKNLSGRRLAVADIYEQARNLERAYAKAGYVLVRVSVPHQILVERGTVKLIVNDGYFERVDASQLPLAVRQFVLARTQKLVGQSHLKLAQIERATLLAGTAAGLHLGSTLVRGEKPNGVVLVLDGQHRKLAGSVTVDNHLGASLGTVQAAAQVAANSAFGLGEQIYGSLDVGLGKGIPAAFNLRETPLLTVGFGANLPVGTDGFSLNPEVTYSKTHPKPSSSAVPATQGELERFALRGNYDVVRSHATTVSVTGGVESLLQRSTSIAVGRDLTLDYYQSAHAGLSLDGAAQSGLSYHVSGQLAHGLGGRSQQDVTSTSATLSRLGASPWFDKFTLQGHLTQPLPDQLSLTLIGQGQWSFGKPLLTSEQMSLDGAEALSGLPPGAGSVDSGAVLRAELARNFAFKPLGQQFVATPYVFAASGLGRLHNAQVGEQAFPWAYSYGLGLRSSFDAPDGYPDASLALELAQARSNLTDSAQETRISISGSLRF